MFSLSQGRDPSYRFVIRIFRRFFCQGKHVRVLWYSLRRLSNL